MFRLRPRILSISLLAGLLLAAPGGTAPEPQEPAKKPLAAPKTYVVLVGVSKYADDTIKPRPHAESDAKAFYDLLTDAKYLGVPKDQVKLLLGSADAARGSEPATRQNVLKAIDWLATTAGPQDVVLYGFFGQAGPLGSLGNRGCYFVADTTFKDRDTTAIAASDLQDVFMHLKADRVCTFVDVNFRDFTADKNVADVSFGAPFQEFLSDYESAVRGRQLRRILFLTTNAPSQALAAEKHGLFTEVVLDGLKGAADMDGNEPDGTVTVAELARYVDQEMPARNARLGLKKQENANHHGVMGMRETWFGLTKNPAETVKVAGRLARFEELAREAKIGAFLQQEGRSLLEKMPKVEAQRKLRAEYQSLADGKTSLSTFEKNRAAILEATRITPEAATAYADRIADVMRKVRRDHFKVVSAGDMVEWGVQGLYFHLEEPIPAAIEARLKNRNNLDEEALLRMLADVRQALGKREDLDRDRDFTLFLQQMLLGIDSYSTFHDAEAKKQFEADTSGNFAGLGFHARKDAATNHMVVVSPILNSPAYKAGLQAGDRITKFIRPVDSEGKKLDPPETVLTQSQPLNDSTRKMRGKPGTPITLVIERDGKEMELPMTRGRVETPSVLGIRRDAETDDWNYWLDEKAGIAYFRLTSFQLFTSRDLQRLATAMHEKGKLKGVVLDLRYNPGGYLNKAVEVADLFLDEGKIVGIRNRANQEEAHFGKSEGSLLGFPMVCLVNGGTISSCEIVTAALQDHRRALILGERTFGKGSVQNGEPWEDGLLRLTIATSWRPNGKNMDKASTGGKDDEDWGVTPDKVIPLTRKERDDFLDGQYAAGLILPRGKPREKSDLKDKQLDAALEYLREKIKADKP